MKSKTSCSLSLLGAVLLAGCGGGGSLSNSGGGGNNLPSPTISSISPASITAGSEALTLTINGTGFLTTTAVQVGGVADATTYVSGTEVTATVTASQVLNAGQLSVVAFNGTASSASGTPVNLQVTARTPPTLTSISPNLGAIGTAVTLTLIGTGFAADSTVAMNGANLSSTYVSSTSITASVPASNLVLPGIMNVTVTTPGTGGGITAPLPYTAYIPIPNNSMVYNPANGLFYVSVPASAGAPIGNSVVSVDPETGALGSPIPVGTDPDQLAISSDGTILWVGLDQASAVRQVNLTTGTAGSKFPIGGSTADLHGPVVVDALTALPGSPNSVVESYFGNVGIFDNGVLRGSPWTEPSNAIYALQADGIKDEIYAAGTTYQNSGYNTLQYSTSGLTHLATAPAVYNFANYSADEIQVANGTLYTDYGQAFNAETGTLLGSFDATGTTVATGPIFADTALGRAFILDNSQGAAYGVSSNYDQIQIFNLSNFMPTGAVIPVALPPVTQLLYNFLYPMHLTRWGANGLAFRTDVGVFSLRSNLINDLSSVSSDLGVHFASPGSATTGTDSIFTATISNAGPSASTDVALTATPPSSDVLLSANASSGACSIGAAVACNLGSIASGANATVQFVVLEDNPGSTTLTASVSSSQPDPNPANNQATATVTVTGAIYYLVPTLTAVNPAAIESGSSDTNITLTGTGFSPASTVLLGDTPLETTYANDTTLKAVVSKGQLAALGWSPITISNPTPGGGISNPVPLYIFTAINIGAEEIVYDPYSRKIIAGVNTSTNPDSLIAIDPSTATVGTPVAIGAVPAQMALTSDGQMLYVVLSGTGEVERFNMLAQQPEYTYAISGSNFGSNPPLRGIAAQPGTENTVALDLGEEAGLAIFDFDPTTKTATNRGQNSGPDSGSCISFLDASNLLAFDVDSDGQTLNHFAVTSAGFNYYDYPQFTKTKLIGFGCFKLSGGLAFADVGGVANPANPYAVQLGYTQIDSIGGGPGAYGNVIDIVAPDAELQRAFYFVATQPLSSYNHLTPDGIEAADIDKFMPSGTVFMDLEPIEFPDTSYQGVDLIRWGQDGLAALTSSGHVYLLRGPLVVPEELERNAPATLSSSSISSITHGAGNTTLTLTGSNFIPGVAVYWNGTYRTTTMIDATHLSIAIPASDLASTGTATLTATNPGAPASNALTVTIN